MKKLLYIMLLSGLPAGMAFGQAQINLNGAYMVNNSTYVVVDNTNTNALITTNNGWIIPKSEFSMLVWNIGTGTGNYIVPFGDTTLYYLPVSLDISTAGTGSGSVKFSTYHTPALNSLDEPSDVTNLTPFFLPGSPSNTDNSYNIADRFFILDANTGYTTKPTIGNLTLSYVSGTSQTEVGSPNTLTESRMMAQRFNSSSDTWNDWYGYGCTDGVSANIGTVQTGPVPASDFYRSWSLWDNTMSLPMVVSGTNTSACGGDGTATATIYGGKPSYTYSWSNGATTSSLSSLTGGTYTVTAKDANGCSSTGTVTITQPVLLATTATVTANVNCNGGNTGNATANPSGGTTPYTYSWSNGTSTVSTSNPTGAVLTAGSYTVTVRDANNCSASASVTITQFAAVTVNWWAIYDVTCNGGDNGKAISTVYGGSLPYTYLWSNGQTTGTVSNVTAGTYTLTVTDANGCTGSNSVTITQPAVTVTETITLNSNLTCHSLPPLNNPDGSATSNPSGGTPPYVYSWIPSGGTSQTAVTLEAGTDYCKVTDDKGCSATASVVLTQPTVIFATFTNKTIPSCNGNSDGSITAVGTGGSGSYTNYVWSPYGGTTATATGLSAQTYTITITDNTGCLGTAPVVMPQPAVLAVSIPSYTCVVGGKAEIEAIATGGTPAYVYSWSNGSTSIIGTKALETFPDGSYTVAVTDEHNCPKVTATINFHSCPEIEGVLKGGDNGGNNNDTPDITVYPNPTNGQFTIAGLEPGQTIEIYDYMGRKISSQLTTDNYQETINISSQPNGIYLIRILDKDGNLVDNKKVVKTY